MLPFRTYWLVIPLQTCQRMASPGPAALEAGSMAAASEAQPRRPLVLRALTLACMAFLNAWKEENEIIRKKALRRAELLRPKP